MQVIKFRENTINGIDKSTFKWTTVTDKDELMVEVFSNERLFEDLSIYWKQLEKRTKPFRSYDWIYNWWKRFGKNKQRSLYLITIWDGTKLVGVAPLYKGYTVFGGLRLETRLQIIGSGGNPNEQLGYLDDYGLGGSLDLIVDQAYTSVIADLLAEDILPTAMIGVDVVKFRRVGAGSFIVQDLLPKLQEQLPASKIKQLNSGICIQNESLEGVTEEGSSFHNSGAQTISIPVQKLSMNIPLLLNHIGAWIYKFVVREMRLMKIQRQQKGFIRMFQGYLSYHWMSFKS